MNIPFIDFSEQYQAIKNEIYGELEKVFSSGAFILGPQQKKFEEDFAKYCEVKYGVGVNSGTDALYLALAALNVDVGDEVILPTHTFIATALCVSYTGAKPVFVDVEDETYNMDPVSFEKAITKRTKAVIPVQLYGQSANMKEIVAIANKHGIKVVEDACQAHGATYQGKKIGSLGDIACFSFYPTKSLGAFGDAGMVVTNDKKVYETVQMLRDYGRVGRYEHKVKGYNSRMDTIQAVVLAAKLKYLDKWNLLRNEKAAIYGRLLKGVTGLTLPVIKKDRTHVFQTYAVRVKNRQKVMDGLKEKGISVLIHYPIPLHLQEAYQELKYRRGDFPVAEAIADDILSLPMFPHLTEEQIRYVCDGLKASLK
jgi:dTDP-4-amino-4,6-dideoxygalactose transaminase